MDTITINTLVRAGEKLFAKTLETSPTEGNGYGIALGVLVLVAIYMGIDRWMERRDTKKYRREQDQKTDKRESDARKRTIEEQQSREQARDRVIEEQRNHRDELRKSFGDVLGPLESRIRDLERKQLQHDKSFVLLSYHTKLDLPREGE
mgnify:FL=1